MSRSLGFWRNLGPEHQHKSFAGNTEFHDEITKPTLYQLCDDKRDMKFSTLLGLSRALEVSVCDLLRWL